MNHRVKEVAIRTFASIDAFPTRATPMRDLLRLLESLHPFEAPMGMVRLGPASDGGYVVPDDLAGIEACLSPGVNDVSGFERACADRGMRVFMADRSVDGPAEKHPLFHFSKTHVGAFPEDGVMTLDAWVRECLPDVRGDLLLQMDIEGAEIEALMAASPELLSRFRIITVEFHAMQELFGLSWFRVAEVVFRKLLSNHACVHAHPNNHHLPFRARGISVPSLMEFTFLRRDRMGPKPWSHARLFPHPLDVDNVDAPAVPLPTDWFRGTAR